MIERTLLINQPFALRQNGGIPVFTTIQTIESQYNESELDNSFIVNKIHDLDTLLNIFYNSTIKQEQIVQYFPCLLGSFFSILMIPCHSVCSRLQTSTKLALRTSKPGLHLAQLLS
jgi:hypothetical protein